jgi:hypothetical protein
MDALTNVAPRLLEYGLAGIFLVLLIAALIWKDRVLNQTQEKRVDEQRVTTDALNNAADSIDGLTDMVDRLRIMIESTRRR